MSAPKGVIQSTPLSIMWQFPMVQYGQPGAFNPLVARKHWVADAAYIAAHTLVMGSIKLVSFDIATLDLTSGDPVFGKEYLDVATAQSLNAIPQNYVFPQGMSEVLPQCFTPLNMALLPTSDVLCINFMGVISLYNETTAPAEQAWTDRDAKLLEALAAHFSIVV
jgi:hypothetical protein